MGIRNMLQHCLSNNQIHAFRFQWDLVSIHNKLGSGPKCHVRLYQFYLGMFEQHFQSKAQIAAA